MALATLLAVGNLWVTFHRSGIPAALDGWVEHVEVRPEKHAGLDDVHLIRISGREHHLDAQVAARLQVGDEVRKPAWSTDLTTPRGTAGLALSRDFVRMALAMPLFLGLGWALLRRRKDD